MSWECENVRWKCENVKLLKIVSIDSTRGNRARWLIAKSAGVGAKKSQWRRTTAEGKATMEIFFLSPPCFWGPGWALLPNYLSGFCELCLVFYVLRSFSHLYDELGFFIDVRLPNFIAEKHPFLIETFSPRDWWLSGKMTLCWSCLAWSRYP